MILVWLLHLKTLNSYIWGCEDIELPGNGLEIGMGYQNTLQIEAQCNNQNQGIIAALATLNYQEQGYSDWFLPSLDELTEAYIVLGLSGWRFSSSLYSENMAYGLHSANGISADGVGFAASIRPIEPLGIGQWAVWMKQHVTLIQKEYV